MPDQAQVNQAQEGLAVDESTLVRTGPAVTRRQWTAPVRGAPSVGTAPLLAVPVHFFDPAPASPSPLDPVWSWLVSVIEATDGWILVLLTLLSVLLGGIALVISPRLPGRKGRWLANLGVALPLIVLVPLGALLIYLLFFWHPHFHFVGEIRLRCGAPSGDAG